MKEINAIIPELIEFRKAMHRHPEIAGKEKVTCAAIRAELAKIEGVRVLPPFLETDTVAFIDGKGAGKNVTLRADIDALPVTEETGCDFASEIPGMMHACGHDMHTTILLGAAKILATKRNEFSGSVRLLFQPGEECVAMAQDMVAAGAIADPVPDFSAGLHVSPGIEVGTIAARSGVQASASRHFCVNFFGKGGHGSRLDLCRSPLLAAAAAVVEAQSIVSTRISPLKSAVLSICSLHSGKLDNVSPETAEFRGTIRALDDESCMAVFEYLQELCNGIAAAYRVRCEAVAMKGYCALVNPASGYDRAKRIVQKIGAPFAEIPEPAMSSEDFSYILNASRDGVFVRLGAGKDQPPLHNCRYLPPEEIIGTGVAFMVETALSVLK